MNDWLEACKPAASARTHLLLVAMMWTIVGAVLTVLGVRWELAARLPYVWPLLAVAAGVGACKSRWLLQGTARRTIGRIYARGDGYCLGGFLSWRAWMFVALMAGMGRVLRGGLVSREVAGFIYTAVGAALLLTTPRIWRAWYRGRAVH